MLVPHAMIVNGTDPMMNYYHSIVSAGPMMSEVRQILTEHWDPPVGPSKTVEQLHHSRNPDHRLFQHKILDLECRSPTRAPKMVPIDLCRDSTNLDDSNPPETGQRNVAARPMVEGSVC